MIGKLTGLVDSAGEDWAVIDVNGVGYHVFCSRRSLERLPPGSGPVALLVETHVREDHIHLFGFIDAAERDWFRLLGTVQGVGARMALSILSVLSPQGPDPGDRRPGQGAADQGRRRRPQAGRPDPGRAEGQGRRPGARSGGVRGGGTGQRRRPRSGRPRTRSRRWSTSATAAARPSAPWPGRARPWVTEAALESLVKAGLKELSA